MTKVSTHITRSARRSELAFVYAGDGALHTAARCLREAADHMELAAEQREADLDALLAKGKPATDLAGAA